LHSPTLAGGRRGPSLPIDLLEHPGQSVLNCWSLTSKARDGPWVQSSLTHWCSPRSGPRCGGRREQPRRRTRVPQDDSGTHPSTGAPYRMRTSRAQFGSQFSTIPTSAVRSVHCF